MRRGDVGWLQHFLAVLVALLLARPALASGEHFYACREVTRPIQCAPYVPPPQSDPYVFRLVKRTTEPQPFTTVAGDGSTDDYCAVQGALDAVPLGGSVVLPAGVYVLCDTLRITRPVTLRGEGTRVGNLGRDSTRNVPGLAPLLATEPSGYYRLPGLLNPLPWGIGRGESLSRVHNYSTEVGGTVIYPVPAFSNEPAVGIDIQLENGPAPVNLSDFILVAPPRDDPDAPPTSPFGLRSDSIGIRVGGATVVASGIMHAQWSNLAAIGFEQQYVLNSSSENTFSGLQLGGGRRGLVLDAGSTGNLFFATNGGALGKAIEIREASLNLFEGGTLQGIAPRLRSTPCPLALPVERPAAEYPAPQEYGTAVLLGGGELNVFESLHIENPEADEFIVSEGGVHNLIAQSTFVTPHGDPELAIHGGAFLKLVELDIGVFGPASTTGNFLEHSGQPYRGGLCKDHLPSDALADPANTEHRRTCGVEWYKALEQKARTAVDCPAHFYWDDVLHPGGIFVAGGLGTRIIDLNAAAPVLDTHLNSITKPDGLHVTQLRRRGEGTAHE